MTMNAAILHSEPLLRMDQYKDSEKDTIDAAAVQPIKLRPRSLRTSLGVSRLFFGLLFLAYTVTIILITKWWQLQTDMPQGLIYCQFTDAMGSAMLNNADCLVAPAREALQYEKQVFHSLVPPIADNPFAGPPRPELDAAWHDLLKSI